MAVASVGDIELWHEQFGLAADPALLLISSLGGQALTWDDEFCERLAARGFSVTRFDLRDSGLSTKLADAPSPDMAAISRGDLSSIAYDLSDIARDVVGLAAAVADGPVHVVGSSLGGMIAQTLAIEHPDVVRTLTVISSSPSFRLTPSGESKAQAKLMDSRRSSDDRELALDSWMDSRRAQASPGFPFDAAATREHLARMFDRSWYPVGRQRQIAAIVASGDRTDRLAGVRSPSLVIHGDSDPLIDVSRGIAIAEAIPGAELLVVEGMGHDLPEPVWNRVVDAIAVNARRGATA